MVLHAIDNFDHSDDTAELKLGRQSDAVCFLDVLRRDGEGRRAGVNKQRAAMLRAPAAILNVLVPIHHQPGPRLLQRESAKLFQSRGPSGKRRSGRRRFHSLPQARLVWQVRKDAENPGKQHKPDNQCNWRQTRADDQPGTHNLEGHLEDGREWHVHVCDLNSCSGR